MRDFMSSATALHPQPTRLVVDDVSGLAVAGRRLWRQKGMILLATLTSAALGWGIATLQVPQYHARATILLDANQQVFTTTQAVVAPLELSTPVIDGEIAVLRSLELIQAVIAALSTGQSVPADLAQFSSDDLRVNRLGNGYAIEVIAASPSAQTATAIANGIADRYITDQRIRRVEAAEQATAWLQRQVAQTRNRLDQATTRLAAARRNEVSASGLSADILQQQIGQSTAQLTQLEDQTAEAQAGLAQLDEDIAQLGLIGSAALIDTPVIGALRSEVSRLTQQDAAQALTYGPDHPERAALRSLLGSATAALAQEVRNIHIQRQRSAGTLTSRMRDLGQNLRSLEAQNLSIATAKQAGDALEFEIGHLRQDHADLSARLTDARAQIDIQQPGARIISTARVPAAPTTPKTSLLTVFAGLCGLALVLFFSALRDSLYPGFRRASEIEVATGIDVIAQLPTPRADNARKFLTSQVDQSQTSFARQIRHLWAVMGPARQTSDFCALLTSMSRHAGTTTTALALAQSCARQGQLTLYIDLTGAGSAMAPLGHGDAPSLHDFFEGQCSLEAAIRHPDGMEFHMLTAGHAGPVLADRISTDDMARLLDTLRARFAMIIIDTPPISDGPDALIVAPAADAVLCQIASGPRPTPRVAVHRGVGMLRRAGVVPTGFILSAVDASEVSA